MSLRSFTVFLDAPSSEPLQPKITRPNAMATRSQRATGNVASVGNVATSSDLAVINKENYNPVTGERAAPLGNGLKKRKTNVLATKIHLAPVGKSKKEKEPKAELEPERKKHKASTTASKAKVTKKQTVKGASSVKKTTTTKRTGLKKVTPMPKLLEEDNVGNSASVEQADVDARCYELTVTPLADVSQAYEEVDVFSDFVACTTSSANAADTNVKFSTVKEASVEPEIRDYYQPAAGSYPSSSRRLLRALSQGPAPRTFSTPERRQIYSAFTFSSPSAATSRPEQAKAMAPVEEVL